LGVNICENWDKNTKFVKKMFKFAVKIFLADLRY